MKPAVNISRPPLQIVARTEIKLIANHTCTVTTRMEMPIKDFHKRTTEIGPVLEAMLTEHWWHGGLND
jgi:hypothetical protein